MLKPLLGYAHCIDGVLDVDWEISPSEDAHFLVNAIEKDLSHEEKLKQLATHCLIKVDPEFPNKVQAGDFLVGYRGVGWGHGHDHAVLALKAVGIRALFVKRQQSTLNGTASIMGFLLLRSQGFFLR